MIGPTASDLVGDLIRLPSQLGLAGVLLAIYLSGDPLHLDLEEATLLLWWSLSLLTIALVVVSWSSRRFADPQTILDPGHEGRATPLLLFVSPFFEELLFRGVFLQVLSLWIPTMWAIGLLALIWAFLHRRPRLLPLDVGIGLAFGLVAVDVGLWAAIIFHLLLNLKAHRRALG